MLLDKSFSGGHRTSARKCYTPATQLYHWSSTDCSSGPVLAIRSLMITESEFREHRKHVPSFLYASTSDKCSGCSWDLWADYILHFFVLWTCLPSVSTTYSLTRTLLNPLFNGNSRIETFISEIWSNSLLKKKSFDFSQRERSSTRNIYLCTGSLSSHSQPFSNI